MSSAETPVSKEQIFAGWPYDSLVWPLEPPDARSTPKLPTSYGHLFQYPFECNRPFGNAFGVRIDSSGNENCVVRRVFNCYDTFDLNGIDRRNSVPSKALRSGHNLPPCASTIDRQMERPRPNPSSLEEVRGSKMRSTISAATPGPLS